MNNTLIKPYAYVNGALAAISHPILGEQQLAQLEAAQDEQHFLRLLREYKYGNDKLSSASEMIDEEFNFVLRFLKENAPSDDVMKIFLFEEDIHNLKLAVKAVIFNKDVTGLFSSRSYYPCGDVYAYAEQKNFDEIDAEFNKDVSAVWNTDNPFEISCIVDNSYFSYIMRTAEKSGEPFLKKYFCEYAKCRNAVTSVRIDALADGKIGSEGCFLPCSADSDDCKFMQTPEEAETNAEIGLKAFFNDNYDPFGIVPLTQYFFEKKSEQKKLRFMLVNKRQVK